MDTYVETMSYCLSIYLKRNSTSKYVTIGVDKRPRSRHIRIRTCGRILKSYAGTNAAHAASASVLRFPNR